MRLSAFSYRVYRYIKEHDLIREGDSVLIGLSGGADSVCLFLCLEEIRKKMPISLSVMHVMHNIRGEEADRDEAFAGKLAGRFEVPYFTSSVDAPDYAKKEGLSLEEAARILRYRALNEEAEKAGAKIAVAHQKDDQAETVLFHLIRGSSLKGMTGMQPKSGRLIRPLLFLSGEEIRSHLSSLGETFCLDSTNLDTDYARNAIRLQILPELSRINAGAADHICRAAKEWGRIEGYLEEKTKKAYLQTIHHEGESLFLPKKAVEELDEILRDRVLYMALSEAAGQKKDLSEVHVTALLKLLSSEGGKRIELPYGIMAQRKRGGIEIRLRDQHFLSDGRSDL